MLLTPLRLWVRREAAKAAGLTDEEIAAAEARTDHPEHDSPEQRLMYLTLERTAQRMRQDLKGKSIVRPNASRLSARVFHLISIPARVFHLVSLGSQLTRVAVRVQAELRRVGAETGLEAGKVEAALCATQALPNPQAVLCCRAAACFWAKSDGVVVGKRTARLNRRGGCAGRLRTPRARCWR